MPSSPLYILWSKNGIAPKNCRKINTNLKATTHYFAVASILIVLFTFNLAPNGVNAAAVVSSSLDGVDESDGVVGDIDLEEGHARSRRAVITPLGKRLTSNLVAELGKRPRHMYSFGIGKRSISSDEMQDFLAEEAQKNAEQKASGRDQDDLPSHPIASLKQQADAAELAEHSGYAEKRDPYSFGLGKRSSGKDVYAFGLGKRDPYAFGLGKRDPYSFGLGKRDPYSFGLGKRMDKKDPYSFGLGKRDPYGFGLGKRDKKDPYSFGLGKRDPYAFGLGKRDPYSFGLGKRDPYSFGLGKRDPYGFGLGKRNPYSFGLGKRDPYSFGLGKRSGDKRLDESIFDENPYAFGLGKRDNAYSFGMGKRDPYSFGLGK